MSPTELAEQTGTPYATAHGEVARLLDRGILAERTAGRTRLLSANPDSPLTSTLREILAVTTGPAVFLAQELSAIPNIDAAFLYGSYAARTAGVVGLPPMDIDVMVLCAPDPDAVYSACDRVERQVGRPVNPSILSPAEASAQPQSAFLQSLMPHPTVPLVGRWP